MMMTTIENLVWTDSAMGWTIRRSNPGGGEIFRTRPECSILCNDYRVILGGNTAGRGINHPPPSSAEVKERIELNLYSSSVPSWQVTGRTFTLYIIPNGRHPYITTRRRKPEECNMDLRL